MVASKPVPVKFRSDNLILSAGTSSFDCYRVRSGIVTAERASVNGHDVPYHFYHKDWIFAEEALRDQVALYSYVAVTDVELEVVTRLSEEKLNHQLQLRMAQREIAFLCASTFEVSHMIVFALMQLVDYEHNTKNYKGDLTITVSVNKLARLSCVNANTVADRLRLMELRGLLQRGYGKLYIRDLEGLRAIYEGQEEFKIQEPKGRKD